MTFNLQMNSGSVIFPGQPRINFRYHGVDRVIEPRSVHTTDHGRDLLLTGLELRRDGKPSWTIKSFRVSKMGLGAA
jgi:hypothetical protein